MIVVADTGPLNYPVPIEAWTCSSLSTHSCWCPKPSPGSCEARSEVLKPAYLAI